MNKQGLFEAVTDRDTLIKILEQADEVLKMMYWRVLNIANKFPLVVTLATYLMRIKDKIDLGRAKILLKEGTSCRTLCISPEP